MKKLLIVFMTFAFLGSLYAGGKEDLLNLLQQQSGRKLSIVSFEPLKASGLSLMVVQDSTNGYRTAILTENKSQTIIVAGLFFSQNNDDRVKVSKTLQDVESYNFKIQNATALNKLFESIPSDYAIKLEGKGSKTTYIISDPMCPYCQDELNDIDSRLQEGNVIMIVVAFLGQESLNKTAEIVSKIQTITTTKDKIALLKNVYSRAHKAEVAPQASIQRVKDITADIQKTHLIESVPFIYEKQ